MEKIISLSEGCNMVSFMFDIDTPDVLSIAVTMKDGKSIEKEKISNTLRNYKLDDNIFKVMYDYCALWAVTKGYEKRLRKRIKKSIKSKKKQKLHL